MRTFGGQGLKTANTGAGASTQGRFLALDALRGFAAIAVALFHFDHWIVPGGYLAVDFFFALSGFVLVNSYADRFASGLTPWRFIRMRVVRVYPLHLAGVALGLMIALQAIVRHRAGHLAISAFVSAAVANPLMLPSPLTSELFPINIPAWSLFFEMVANIALALVLMRLRLRGLLIVVAIAAVLLVLSVGLMPFAQDPLSPPKSAVTDGTDWITLHIGLARTFFSFSLGMALALLPRSELRVQTIWALPSCAVLLVLLALPIGERARLTYDLAVVCLASPLLIYWCSRFEPDRHFARVAAFVGEISFALYAVHYQVLGVFYFIENRTHLSHTVLAPLFLAVSMLVAWAAVRWFDIPARRYLGRLILR